MVSNQNFKPYHRVFLFVLLVLLLTCLVSPWLAMLWDIVLSVHPEWEKFRQPFSRIFDRTFIAIGVIAFVVCRRLLMIDSFAQLGLSPSRRALSDASIGFLLSLGSLVALIAVMTHADVFTPSLRGSFPSAARRSFNALMAGLTVGFIEEVFFRAIIFKGLLEQRNFKMALVVANLFYAAIHFVKPAARIPISEVNAWSGFHHVAASFTRFLDLDALAPGILGLFLIGVVLSYAYFRTGSLYMAIGLHAGWVFGLKTMRLYGRQTHDGFGWMFGASEPRIVSGLAAWLGILLVGVLVHWLTCNRTPLRQRQR